MQRQAALFVGHGSPMNVIADNEYTRSLHRLGRELPKPRAILSVSAHWRTTGAQVLDLDAPPTIHDFFGFPCELYQVKYPAPGAPDVVRAVEKLAGGAVRRSKEWGLDHGTWAVLHHMYPEAKIPVTQLSLDNRLDYDGHLELAAKLKPLREDGVMILGSGNIVHNLREFSMREDAEVMPWAEEFDSEIKRALKARELDVLLHFKGLDRALVRRAIPTPEHYLPLVYILGASDPSEKMSFPYEEIQNGSVAMRSIRFG